MLRTGIRWVLPGCLALVAACSGADKTGEAVPLAVEGPCPGIIGEAEAIRLAKGYADAQNRGYQENDIRANWDGAYWSVATTVDVNGESRLAFVEVGADAKVAGCEVDEANCGTARNFPKGSCMPADGNVPSAGEAQRIAAAHLKSYDLIVDGRYENADWYGANWRVSFWPDPPIIDAHFTVHVSPDGKEFDVSGAFTMYSKHGFVRRPPGDDTRPISAEEAVEKAKAYLRGRGIAWPEEEIRASWISDRWYVSFAGGPSGSGGDIRVTVAWDGKASDYIRYQAPDPAIESCPDTGKSW